MDTDLLQKLNTALNYGGGTHTAEDVAQAVLDGDAQAWQRDNNLIVTQIEEFPRSKVLVFWIAAGDLEPLLEMSKEICEWGRSQGCDSARIVGRKGWKPKLDPLGWEQTLVTYTKEL